MTDPKSSGLPCVSKVMEIPAKEVERPPGGSNLGPQTLALNTHKAGMEGLDADKINEIIKKASEGSKFYQHKQKCQKRLDAKIAEMMKVKESFSEQQIARATRQMDQIVEELEKERDLTHTIVHVDMDMFYAAVEMRDDPSLRNKPMAVGGPGMLSTSNYAARKFGVRAAMPGFIGKKLCPDLIIVPPNFVKYKECSKIVQKVFAEYDPNFSPMSLDEAYLDITEYIKKNGHLYSEESCDDMDVGHVAENIVKEMREKIHQRTQLTASAGIAPNTRLAKICSDLNKPNGQFYLPPVREKIRDFILTLPIRKISGIGNVSEQQLSALGIKVCSDLHKERGVLKLLFSDLNYNHFMSIALGLGSTTLEAWTERERKSISTETTFRGTSDKEYLFKVTEDLCQELAEDMAEKDIFGKVFTLKIKTTDFKLKTKAHSFLEPSRCCEVMVSTARKLLQHEMDISAQPLSLRLIGVRMSSLLSSSEVGPSRQVTLTDLFSKANHLKSSSKSSEKVSDESRPNSSSLHDDCDVDFLCEDQESVTSETASCSRDQFSSLDKRGKAENSHSNSFFNLKKKAHEALNQSFECPICNLKVQATSIAKFNIHIDKCLQNSSSKDTTHLSKLSSSLVSASCETNEMGPSRKRECSSFDERTDVDFSPVRSSMEGTSENPDQNLLCPICNKKRFVDIYLLNQHIDECLNMGEIDKILQKKDQGLVGSSLNDEKLKGHSFLSSTKKKCVDESFKSVASHPKKKQKTVGNTLEKYFTSLN